MFTTETTIILPIVIILILCIMAFAFFLAELDITALSTERAFIMQVCEELYLNGVTAKKSEHFTIKHRGVWTHFDINYGRVIGNPFKNIMNKSQFEFDFSYTLMRLNRLRLKLVLLGGGKLFEIE